MAKNVAGVSSEFRLPLPTQLVATLNEQIMIVLPMLPSKILSDRATLRVIENSKLPA